MRILPEIEVNPEITKRNINFTINDGTDPIEGAVVTIDDITGTTGSAGGCTLREVSDGEHTVIITADSFESFTEVITVNSENTSFTFTLSLSSLWEAQQE